MPTLRKADVDQEDTPYRTVNVGLKLTPPSGVRISLTA